MRLNKKIFEQVQTHNAQILVVTKYYSPEDTLHIWEQVKDIPCTLALGENRIADIKLKKQSRENIHFIGNIQSRDIPEIVEFCSEIHSLASLKHAHRINEETQKQFPHEKMNVFIQVNISEEPQKRGIAPKELEEFLQRLKDMTHLNVLGISALGAGEFTPSEKQKEFQRLKKLRNKFFPGKKISAGTSRDYKIALNEGIEVVRVGNAVCL